MSLCSNCIHECGEWDEYCTDDGWDASYSWNCEIENCYAPLDDDEQCLHYKSE